MYYYFVKARAGVVHHLRSDGGLFGALIYLLFGLHLEDGAIFPQLLGETSTATWDATRAFGWNVQ
jgi:hypothetical protein